MGSPNFIGLIVAAVLFGAVLAGIVIAAIMFIFS